MAQERQVIDRFEVTVPMDAGTMEQRFRLAITRAEEISELVANGARWKQVAGECIGPRWVIERHRAAMDKDDDGEDLVDYE